MSVTEILAKAESIGRVIEDAIPDIRKHLDSLPQLEQLITRYEAVADRLEAVVVTADPAAGKVAAQVDAGAHDAAAIAGAAIDTAEEQETAQVPVIDPLDELTPKPAPAPVAAAEERTAVAGPAPVADPPAPSEAA